MKWILNLEHSTYTERMEFYETYLRGMYIKLASEIEFMLSEIITICFVKDIKGRKQFKTLILETPTLGKKISLTKQVLFQYSEHYYNIIEPSLTKLEEFTALRNLFAHSLIIYDPKQENEKSFTFTYIKKSQMRKESKEILPIIQSFKIYEEELIQISKLLNTLIKENGISDYFLNE